MAKIYRAVHRWNGGRPPRPTFMATKMVPQMMRALGAGTGTGVLNAGGDVFIAPWYQLARLTTGPRRATRGYVSAWRAGRSGSLFRHASRLVRPAPPGRPAACRAG